VWGTDWPHVNLKEPTSDKALFGLLAQVAPDDRSRTRLLADNPARLYGFSTSDLENSLPRTPEPISKYYQSPFFLCPPLS
jgi:hypothetical protein